MLELTEAAEALRGRLAAAVQGDAAAFDAVLQAMRLSRATEPEQQARSEAIRRATVEAARVPLEVALASVEAAELAAEVAEVGNPNAISDAATGVALARAALQGAALNVRVNTRQLGDAPEGRSWEQALADAARRMEAAEARLRAALRSRAGIDV
jgi:glutamate formiminotransferase/formiminotetrahydrofolate cyclodeaminase